MTTQYLSLSNLASQLELYERLPVPISSSMKLLMGRAVAANGITIIFSTLGASLITEIAYSWQGFFTPTDFLSFPAEIANFLANVAQGLNDYLLPLNLLSLAIIGVVFMRSRWFSQPVEEVFHWLSASALIPAAIGILAVVLIGVGFLTNIVVTIALWLLLIVIVLFVLALILVLLGGVLAASAI